MTKKEIENTLILLKKTNKFELQNFDLNDTLDDGENIRKITDNQNQNQNLQNLQNTNVNFNKDVIVSEFYKKYANNDNIITEKIKYFAENVR